LLGGCKLEIEKGMKPWKGPMERYGSKPIKVDKITTSDPN